MTEIHGVKCSCGKCFGTLRKLNRHITKNKVMEELKKYVSEDSPIYKAQDSFNHDRGGGFEVVADAHNIEIKPSNAQEIAKKCIIDLVINEDYEKRLDYYREEAITERRS